MSGRGQLGRAVAASLVVVACAAALTAVAGLLQVADIVKAINGTPALAGADVKVPPPGAPQTLLLIGSDHRASDGTNYTHANTDTMMLARIDDSSSTVNLLSIPRDLRVQLPGGTAKLNAAYSEGGPNLLIKTLKRQVFPGLVVNHIFDVNFAGFSDMVDAIGCVYSDVDHRYFNQTQPAPSPDDYSSIDIQPGYQKLCGDNQADTGALAFVRFATPTPTSCGTRASRTSSAGSGTSSASATWSTRRKSSFTSSASMSRPTTACTRRTGSSTCSTSSSTPRS